MNKNLVPISLLTLLGLGGQACAERRIPKPIQNLTVEVGNFAEDGQKKMAGDF